MEYKIEYLAKSGQVNSTIGSSFLFCLVFSATKSTMKSQCARMDLNKSFYDYHRVKGDPLRRQDHGALKTSMVGPTNNFFFQEQFFFSRNNFCLVFYVL